MTTLVDGEPVAGRVEIQRLGHRRIDLPATIGGSIRRTDPHSARRLRRHLAAPRPAGVAGPCVFVDGKLIGARQLVNGTTIGQEHGWTAVDYFHVELDAHAVLLAEGLPAESFSTPATATSWQFRRADAAAPDLTDEADYPTREAASCAPFVWDEASVRPVWQRLADRAAALGQPVPQRRHHGCRPVAGRQGPDA